MKRIIGMLALAALLITPSLAFAEQIGVYVAPKFVYGYTQMQRMKAPGVYDSGTPISIPSNKIGNKTDNAFGGALAIGYDFNKKFQVPVRAELEYAIFSEVSGKRSWDGNYPFFDGVPSNNNVSTKQKLQIQTLFVNAYYDFRNSTAFTPWVGAGLGMAFINSKGNFFFDDPGYDPDEHFGLSLSSKTSTNFAWNVGAGVAYDFTSNISLDLGYRFAGLGKAETKSATGENGYNEFLTAKAKTSNVYMHQLMLGLRFTF